MPHCDQGGGLQGSEWPNAVFQLPTIRPRQSQRPATTTLLVVWRRPPHLHKECPEAEKENSTPNSCNCSLKEVERPHPSNYRGCIHAKEETFWRKKQRSHIKGTSGRTFSSNYVTTGQSFAAALCSNSGQQPQMRQAHQVQRTTAERISGPPPVEQHTQPTGQSVQTSNVNSSSLDDMFKVAAVVQQIMTADWGCVRRNKNSGHYRNCPESNETRWPLEFIGP
jgi:hypothetical protein